MTTKLDPRAVRFNSMAHELLQLPLKLTILHYMRHPLSSPEYEIRPIVMIVRSQVINIINYHN